MKKNGEEDELKVHINQMTILIQQQQWAEKYGSWTLPQR
jgi:hypothetical protein